MAIKVKAKERNISFEKNKDVQFMKGWQNTVTYRTYLYKFLLLLITYLGKFLAVIIIMCTFAQNYW